MHNIVLKKIPNLKYAKQMWDKLEILFGGDNNNNAEVEKKKMKKDPQNKESQPEESHLPSTNGLADHVKKS